MERKRLHQQKIKEKQLRRRRSRSLDSIPQSRRPNFEKLDEALAQLNFFINDDQRSRSSSMLSSDNLCANCQLEFSPDEQIIKADGQILHSRCFVCAQCFQGFENGIFFEHEDRKYCEKDFQILFAPRCSECKNSIVGRLIRVGQNSFHPDCFRCSTCRKVLVEIGFTRSNNKIFCRQCHSNLKTNGKEENSNRICGTCQKFVEKDFLSFHGEFHHAAHFRCDSCRSVLDENAREVRSNLFCLDCYQKLDLPVCGACRRLIDDRVISALGKKWHVEHFCCSRCAQPFRGSKHFEHKGLAYCELDYHFLFGSSCFICNRIITEGAYAACNKKFCAEHFSCSICEAKMNEKSKFFDVDATPVCKTCYGKLPLTTRKSIEQTTKKKFVGSFFNKNSL